jgi:putative two-component system response regulator
MQKLILAVDDEPNNLNLLLQILRDRYRLMFANNGAKALEVARAMQPDLILLDVMMPGLDGFEVCRLLKADPRLCHIPVLFLTAMHDVEDEARAFDMGAVDFVHKPFSAPILLRRVATHLNLVRLAEVERARREAVYMLGEAGHYNDNDTGAHIWRMANYACALARALGWADSQVELLELAAPLHDTGKIGIPGSILKAPRALTPEEWVIMRSHTVIGAQILENGTGPAFEMAARIARSHHERWDGAGYPDGLRDEQIPEPARIVAVADVFDALTMQRPYKHAWSCAQARQHIIDGAGSHFEPRVVEAFADILPQLLAVKEEWDGGARPPSRP